MAGTPTLAASVAIAFALSAFAPAAEARHHRGHHHANAKKAAAPALIPAHQKPGYVGIAAVPLPGLIDVGLGPVFPFEGWPK